MQIRGIGILLALKEEVFTNSKLLKLEGRACVQVAQVLSPHPAQ
jgi:hypothetical protein